MLPSLPGICGGGLATPFVLMAHNRTLSMLSWTFQVPRFGFQGNSTVITVDYSMTTRSLSIIQNYHTHPSAKQYNVKLSWWSSYVLWFVDLVPITCGYQKPTLQWTWLSGQNWWMDPERGHVNQMPKEVPSHSTTANAEVTLWRRARSTVEKLGTHCSITIRHEMVEVLISGCGYQSHQSIKPILIQIVDATAFTMKI